MMRVSPSQYRVAALTDWAGRVILDGRGCRDWRARVRSGMGVVIVVRLVARAGQGETIVTAATREFEAAAARVDCRSARLFQALGDPSHLLYVAEWDSREAFEAHARHVRTAALDALAVESEGPYYCRELYSYEDMARRAEVVACAIGEAPPESAAAMRALASDLGRTASQVPGLIFYRLAEDVERPGRLVILHGWDSEASLARARGPAGRSVQQQLRALGARVTVSLSRARAAYDRAPG
jgi:quinol monooxygenase YgiN